MTPRIVNRTILKTTAHFFPIEHVCFKKGACQRRGHATIEIPGIFRQGFDALGLKMGVIRNLRFFGQPSSRHSRTAAHCRTCQPSPENYNVACQRSNSAVSKRRVCLVKGFFFFLQNFKRGGKPVLIAEMSGRLPWIANRVNAAISRVRTRTVSAGVRRRRAP